VLGVLTARRYADFFATAGRRGHSWSMRTFLPVLFASLAAASVLAAPSDARACGGCFVPQAVSTQVTDHRMAFSVSKQQTILWDQIRYSGDPGEWAWVLPVRAGTEIELSTDSFFAALDAVSNPAVVAPSRSGGGGGGCSLGCGASSASALGGDNAVPPVVVVSQKVVGPYEAVILRSTDTGALVAWLTKNQFAIPAGIQPTIDAYVKEQFDFAALKLRPGQGVRAMKPVRVVFPGADATLPLRMVAAGIGARVGVTLFVLGEGRYQTQNFPSGRVDETQLFWDWKTSKSNYVDLAGAVMKKDGERTWLLEAARHAFRIDPELARWSFSIPGLEETYDAQCATETNGGPLFQDAGSPPPDAGADADPDAGAGADADADAGADPDAGTDTDAGSTPPKVCDDLDRATAGMVKSQVWLTRLRADLPAAGLAQDLRLEAAPEQKVVPHILQSRDPDSVLTNDGSSAGGKGCSTSSRSAAGAGAEVAACALGLAWVLRRRRRK
jgi:hypothetical protein